MSDTSAPEGPIRIGGMIFAIIPMAAAASVWFAIGMTHEAWNESKIPASRVRQPKPFSDHLGAICIVVAACLGLHALAWLARYAVRRQERMLGMRSQFWNVLYAVAYAVGFIGGFLIYLSAPDK